jgi:hypothetical protein
MSPTRPHRHFLYQLIDADATGSRQIPKACVRGVRMRMVGVDMVVIRMPPTLRRATNRRFNSLLGARHSAAHLFMLFRVARSQCAHE